MPASVTNRESNLSSSCGTCKRQREVQPSPSKPTYQQHPQVGLRCLLLNLLLARLCVRNGICSGLGARICTSLPATLASSLNATCSSPYVCASKGDNLQLECMPDELLTSTRRGRWTLLASGSLRKRFSLKMRLKNRGIVEAYY